MYRFFSSAIRPLLDAAKPSVVVEVGSDRGHGTELIADWCQVNGAAFHCVDPLPKYDVDEWKARWPETITFHLDLSLNALIDVGAVDVALIDGDHNWYSVYHELDQLARSADAAGKPFPLTLLHDVEWPYGRRDLYYDPSTIPDTYRHPHRKGGIAPGSRALQDAGFNDHLENAIHEGTPRNGVRTGVEDFVEDFDGDLRFEVIPGLHGLGIIIDAASASADLKAAVDQVLSADGIRAVAQAVEDDRLERLQANHALTRSKERLAEDKRLSMQRMAEYRQQIEQLKVSLETQQESTEAARLRSDEFERRATTAKQQLATAESRLAAEERKNRKLTEQVVEARRNLDRLRNRRSVKAVLKAASYARPVFQLRRGQLTRRVRQLPASTSSKQSGPSREQVSNAIVRLEAVGTGHFYAAVGELLTGGVPGDFAHAWQASESRSPNWDRTVERPLVSIIMPTHNRVDLIGEAITSVLEQTYPAWELLVCDDDSDDGTDALVAAIDDPRIRYQRLPRGGAARARNAGLAAAEGEYISYLDSDNLWHPEFLETLIGELIGRPGVHGAYSNFVDVNVTPTGMSLKKYSDLAFDYDRLADRNFIDLNGFVHRRRLYDHLGGFDDRLARQQDWSLILKYAFLRELRYVDRLLVLYRRNEDWGQITTVNRGDRTSPTIVRSSVEACYRAVLPAFPAGELPSMTVVSWDICRNHFSKAYNIAESMEPLTDVQLLGFQFFDEPIFPPYTTADPAFTTTYLPGGEFPDWSEHLARAVAAVSGDVVYAVKPRLPSLGVALLANYHKGTPILLESNDLESVVTKPRAGQETLAVPLHDVDPADPELRNPYGSLWTGIMEHLATQVPLRVTHNTVLDDHFGGGAFFLRNLKDERHFDPSSLNRDDVRRRLGFGPSDRVILFGGMVRKHKGIFELVRLIEADDSPYRLLVVGSRNTPDQMELQRRMGDRVTIIEPVDRNEMAAVNLACDAVVLWLNPDVPASRYQMPYKLTDALAMRVPVIANDIGDLGEFGRRGLVKTVPFGDVAELARTLDDLFRHRDQTEEMVEAGRRFYLREFSYQAARSNISMMLTEASAAKGTLPVANEFAEFFAAFRAVVSETPS